MKKWYGKNTVNGYPQKSNYSLEFYLVFSSSRFCRNGFKACAKILPVAALKSRLKKARLQPSRNWRENAASHFAEKGMFVSGHRFRGAVTGLYSLAV